jgi:hypothetical protein
MSDHVRPEAYAGRQTRRRACILRNQDKIERTEAACGLASFRRKKKKKNNQDSHNDDPKPNPQRRTTNLPEAPGEEPVHEQRV